MYVCMTLARQPWFALFRAREVAGRFFLFSNPFGEPHHTSPSEQKQVVVVAEAIDIRAATVTEP